MNSLPALRLESLRVERTPGIEGAFELRGFSGGFDVIVGPNASGKSSSARALRAILWPALANAGPLEASARFAVGEGEGRWRAEFVAPGTVRWQRAGLDSEPPALPPEHLARCFSLRLAELVRLDGTERERIVESLRDELGGGYRLDRLSAEAQVPRTFARREMDEFVRARQEHESVLQRLTALASDEAGLAELERELAAAAAAERELRVLEAAEELAALRAKLQALLAQRAALPAEISPVTTGDAARFAGLSRDIEARTRELAAAEAEEHELEETLAAGGVAPRAEDLAQMRAILTNARRLHDELARLAAEETRAAAAESEALLWLGDGAALRPDAAALAAIDEFLGEASALRAERAQFELLLRAQTGRRDPGGDPDVLAEAVEVLLHWAVAARSPEPRPATWRVVALGALVLGAIVATVRAAPTAAAGLGGLALGFALDLETRRRRAHAWRMGLRDLRAHYEDLGVVEPPEWKRKEVARHIKRLKREWAEAERAQAALEEARRLEQTERELAERERAHAERRRALAERTGMKLTSELVLAEFARRLDRAAQAQAAMAALDRTLDELRERAQGELAAARAVLERHGVGAEGDLPRLEARVGELEARAREGREATAKRAALARRIATLRSDLAGKQEERAPLLALAGTSVDPERTLRTVAEQCQRARDLERDLSREGERERELAAQLGNDVALAELDAGTRRARLAEARSRSARRGELHAQEGALRERLQAARGGETSERSLHALEEARASLSATVAAGERRTARRIVLEDVEREVREVSRPAVVRAAQSLFARFTRDEWSLALAATTNAEEQFLRAVESVSGVGRSPAELSDGTRTQLFLALRLAFAGVSEREVALPIVLDEVLAVSDPGRFDAIAEVLFELAAQGRQILYFASDAAVHERLLRFAAERGRPAPALVDLAEARSLAKRTGEEREVILTPVRAVADPNLPAEEFAVREGIALPDSRRPVDEVELFHVLREDLASLRELHVSGYRRIGQWRALLARHGAAALVPDAALRARIEARIAVVEKVLAVHVVGRGRRLSRADLATCPALSETMLERIGVLLERTGGDARLLVGALEAGEARHFRAAKREEFEAWLVEQGFLDPRPPLGVDVARDEALAVARGAIADGRLSAEEVTRLVESIFASCATLAEREARSVATERAPS